MLTGERPTCVDARFWYPTMKLRGLGVTRRWSHNQCVAMFVSSCISNGHNATITLAERVGFRRSLCVPKSAPKVSIVQMARPVF